MSLLAILLPTRGRSSSAHAWTGGAGPVEREVDSAAPAPQEWDYVFSADGRTLDREGCASADGLPRAERVVLVAQDEDVAWLQARLPKTAAARLKDVLSGAFEEQLLEDTALTHLAVSAQGLRPDESTWVAALHKPWILQVLDRLKAQGIQADALVSLSEPGPSLGAHARLSHDGQAMAVVSGPHGVALWPLGWPGWRARFDESLEWTAEPAAAQALLEHGGPSRGLLRPQERALQAALNGTNLLQFDLTPQMKGSRAILAAWAAFKDPRFRVVHVGLAALVLIQSLGLNASAWQARREVQALQLRAEEVLRESFPTIKVVVDPVVQAERELVAMRRTSGLPGPADLETWLDLITILWTGQPEPLTLLKMDPQGITLEAGQWPEAVVQLLREHAQRQGWQVQLQDRSLRLIKPSAGAR